MRKSLYILLAALLNILGSCESDYSFSGSPSSIAFSVDTLSLDSVFTSLASATHKLMIYNRSGKDMTIDNISLRGGQSSLFNVNINGANATSVSSIHLCSGDSLYVFVNVLPPASDEKVYIVEDDIVVTGGSNVWTAHLLAYGLNVHRLSGHISQDTQFTNDIPYLISDTLSIDSGVSLILPEGTTLYMNEGSTICVYGSLFCQGSHDNMVSIRGYRIEKFYDDVPAQWNSIHIMPTSGSLECQYTDIANSSYGIIADSASHLSLEAVKVRDAMHCAIKSYAAQTDITNSLIYNCGGPLLSLSGGRVSIIHSTLSNYFRWESRFDASVVGDSIQPLESLSIINSIIVGNTANEVQLDESFNASNTLISHSYLRLGTKWKEDDDPRLNDVIVGKEPGFVNRETFDFHITEDSPLRDVADAQYADSLPTDFDGVSRNMNNTSDIGAFEFIPVNNDNNE